MRLVRPVVLVAAFAALSSATSDAKAEEPGRPTKSTSPLIVTGAVSLAVGYVPGAVMGLGSLGHFLTEPRILCGGGGAVSFGRCPENSAMLMLVPIAGPLLYAAPSRRDDVFRPNGGPSSAEQVFLYTSAALQAAGVVMLAVGALGGGTTKRENTLVVAPTGSGVAALGTF